MASYIKTDTNVFDAISETEDYWVVKGKRSGTTYKKYKNATALLGQSDSLAKLCDMSIAWEESQLKPISCPLGEDGGALEKLKRAILLGKAAGLSCWLKLGIWTKKGLEYVAEMAMDGSWELS